MMKNALLDFARQVVNDPAWDPSPDDLGAMGSLDWRGTDREAAVAMVRWCYWEPRVPPSERHFYPGGDSRVGFLAWGEDLDTVIGMDQRWLREHGWEVPEAGGRLKAILDAATAAHERRIPGSAIDSASGGSTSLRDASPEGGVLIGALRVEIRAYRGFQRCVFPGCVHAQPRQPCAHSGVDFALVHTTGTLHGPGIVWHLIAAHGFFGGPGSPYRVAPEKLCVLLDAAQEG